MQDSAILSWPLPADSLLKSNSLPFRSAWNCVAIALLADSLPADIIICEVVVAPINSQSLAVSLSFASVSVLQPDPSKTAASSSLASLSFMQKGEKIGHKSG